MYYSWMELCSWHGHSVVIRELSFYPQSLLEKLSVVVNTIFYCSLLEVIASDRISPLMWIRTTLLTGFIDTDDPEVEFVEGAGNRVILWERVNAKSCEETVLHLIPTS